MKTILVILLIGALFLAGKMITLAVETATAARAHDWARQECALQLKVAKTRVAYLEERLRENKTH